MKPQFSPDNSPEAREGRKRALEPFSGTHSYYEPVVTEINLEETLRALGSAGMHDDSFDNVIRFPVERTRPPEEPEPKSLAV